jgi:hypothetical protein
MVLDPRQSLQLAFAHLDAFSVPGIGTFRRARYSAVLDHQAGTIQPPGERFILEKGEALVERLQDFYFRYLHLSIGKADELVASVAGFVQGELQKGGSLILPGIGQIQRSGASGYDLVPEASLHTHSDKFFGLAPVAYTLNTTSAVTQTEKVEAARRESAMRSVPVEPAPKPVRKQRSFRGVVVTLLLVVMAASAAGIIWQDQFQGWLQQAGWIGQGSGDPHLAPNANNGVGAGTQTETTASEPPVAVANPEPSPAAKAPTQPAPKPNTVPKASPKPDPIPGKEEASADLADFDGIGEHANDDTYYLVVGARKDATTAKEIAGRITKGGIKARILVPRQAGAAHYKVFVYADRTKSKVIEKMVAWKDKFPEKSWIFWLGM